MGIFLLQADSIPDIVDQSSHADDMVAVDTIETTDSDDSTNSGDFKINTSIKKIKSLNKVDSLFTLLERKEIEVKKIKQEIIRSEGEVIEKHDTIPPELVTCEYTEISWPVYKNIDFINQRTNTGNVFKTKTDLKVNNHENREKSNGSAYPSDLVLVVILSLSVVVILMKNLFSKYFNNYFQTAFNYQFANKLFRDKNFFLTRFNFILNILYIVILSIFIYQTIYFFDINTNPDKSKFVYILTIVLGITMGRFLIQKTVGEIFDVQKEFTEYIFNQFLFNKLLGLVLIPLIFIIQYVPESFRTIFIFVGLLLIVSSYLIKLIRGFIIIVKKDILIFYVLLYLCTLEILPVLVGYTYFKRLI